LLSHYNKILFTKLINMSRAKRIKKKAIIGEKSNIMPGPPKGDL